MGLFCVNLHFRTEDHGALSAALDQFGNGRRRILPAKNGWTSLFEEQASMQDENRIRELGEGLSQELGVPAIAFLVHDSDIACYWLFDQGRLLDEYNSSPHYFDAHEADEDSLGPSGGQPEILARYCRNGVDQEELRELLAEEAVFAEAIVERLADALGIAVERALADYGDVADGGEGAEFGDDFNDEDDGPNILPLRTPTADQLTAMLRQVSRGAPADPQATALVEAAARNDVDEIDRLVSAGADIDAEGPAPLPAGQPMAGLSQLLGTAAAKFAMTPLLAAVVHKQRRAAERLLDLGADSNRIHPLFGGPVHAATAAGDVELLELLLDRGGNAQAPNLQGQTPLQLITAGRGTLDRLAQAQKMMRSMGFSPPAMLDQLSSVQLPMEGWDACEQLLKARIR
jgi:hypothetical protein